VATRRISEQQIDKVANDLHELAYNLWWSWNPLAQQIFQELSPFFWEHSNHNPVEVIHWISGTELRGKLQDPEFFSHASAVVKSFQEYMKQRTTWASKNAPSLRKAPVAYFSAEFGLHESLRIYSGGLGILSGDHAKSASDLGLPFIGISLFYRQGYFNQQITNDGWQQELYPTYDASKLPITLVKDKKGNPVVCSLEIGNTIVAFQAWTIQVGRVNVYLLDTNLPQNDDRSKEITAHVYGGDQTTRIAQEIVLGIGGVRLLRAIGVTPSVFHMNEGHAAFLGLELLREQYAAKKSPEKAQAIVKQQCVFTTHTPVPAGHDRFSRDLMNTAFQ
jgi:starch phosphorylase